MFTGLQISGSKLSIQSLSPSSLQTFFCKGHLCFLRRGLISGDNDCFRFCKNKT